MQWIAGPMTRALVEPIIFGLLIFNSIIPVWGIVACPLLGWWAVA